MKNKNYILITLLIISLLILFYTLFKTKKYSENFAVKNEDCKLTDWTDWSECDRPCGGGKRIRTRTVISHEKGDGKCFPLVQEEVCNDQECSDLDCLVSDWKNEGECSKNCGGGVLRRTRRILRNPKIGGLNCPALISEIGCNLESCPVNCEVSNWSDWTDCSKNCGGGVQSRSKRVISLPLFGGSDCPEDLFEERQCNKDPCPVDCTVSAWTDWSKCTKDCGGGTQTRTRTKLSDALFGGEKCPALTESRECNVDPCPIDCEVSDWGDWSNCSAECGGGTQSRERKIITSDEFGGKKCPNLKEARSCNTEPCPVDCEVSFWGKWGPCSKKCGGGERERKRKIIKAPFKNGKECPPLSEVEKCNMQECPVNCSVSKWGSWTKCSKECGGGKRTRTREVTRPPKFDGEDCPSLVDIGQCNIQPCPIDCEVLDWNIWGKCSKECGGGKQTRTRDIKVPPQNGGKECPKLDESRLCNEQPCPVDCKVSNWSDFSECSAECGGGTQSRTRTITKDAMYGGEECPELMDIINCNQKPCPVDCEVSDWSPFSSCSKECGGGTQERRRDILVRPKYGGKECPELVDRIKCNTQACPQACKVSEWGPYSKCSKACGGGTQSRTRVILKKPEDGGENCPELIQTVECNTQQCDGTCIVSAWDEWSLCSKECGGGIRKRSRTILSKPTKEYSKCPPLEQIEECNIEPCERGYKPKVDKKQVMKSGKRVMEEDIALNRSEIKILENAVKMINDNSKLLSENDLAQIGGKVASEFVDIFGKKDNVISNKESVKKLGKDGKIEKFVNYGDVNKGVNKFRDKLSNKVQEEACGKYVECKVKSIVKKERPILDLNPVYGEGDDYYIF